MDESMKKARERFEDEFKQASSSEKWDVDNVDLMKNLLKSMYYIDVICAMKDGNDYPGSEYMPAMSYARGGQRRNAMGQYSRNGSYDGRGYGDGYSYDMGNDGRGSGYYPMYPMNSYDNYRGGMSGRRYYDDERGNAVHKIEHMMETEMNPEKRKAMQDILGVIQMR